MITTSSYLLPPPHPGTNSLEQCKIPEAFHGKQFRSKKRTLKQIVTICFDVVHYYYTKVFKLKFRIWKGRCYKEFEE